MRIYTCKYEQVCSYGIMLGLCLEILFKNVRYYLIL